KPLCIGLNRAMPPPPLFYRVVKLWQIAGRFSGEIWVFLQPQPLTHPPQQDFARRSASADVVTAIFI
ncbi:MAG: hypothetical protein PHS51_13080, partial [Gallionella sp.]|nr:hypothetical protein [Gallionella sp.]